MRYATLRDWIVQGLEGSKWEDAPLHPGPSMPEIPGRFVVLTRAGGPGFSTEGLIDNLGWQVRVAGDQGDYDDAEGLAFHIDRWLTGEGYSRTIGGVYTPNIRREGSPPDLLLVDDADRTHFVCSYITTVQSGI